MPKEDRDMTYETVKAYFENLCEREGDIYFIEAELKNKGIIVWFHDEYIILNKSYFKKR